MFVSLARTGCVARVVVCEAFVEGLHSNTHGFEVPEVEQFCLLLGLLGDDQHMILLDRILVQQQGMSLSQIIFNTNTRLEWFEKDISLPERGCLLARQAYTIIIVGFLLLLHFVRGLFNKLGLGVCLLRGAF